MEEVKAGDVVMLKSVNKSIGPLMTAEKIFKDQDGDNAAMCSWFDGKEPKDKTFKVIALQVVKQNF